MRDLIDLEELAKQEHGAVYARTYRTELMHLQALIKPGEEVSALTTGGHGVRTGVFVVTENRCLYCVKRFFRWHDLREFPFLPSLVIDAERHGKYVALGFGSEDTDLYWISLGVQAPNPRDLARLIVDLVRVGNGTVHGESAIADG